MAADSVDAATTDKIAPALDVDKIADRIETVSMGLGVASGVAALGAALAAPTGLAAIGVAIGVVSAPAVVVVAPILGVAATVAGTVSGTAYFYSKWKRRQMLVARSDPAASPAKAD